MSENGRTGLQTAILRARALGVTAMLCEHDQFAFETILACRELRIRVPAALARFLAYKGSITVNGVSLTVNRVEDMPVDANGFGCEISINLIPHTVQNTALHVLQAGSRVNLEIDLIARYVERMLTAGKA